MKFISYKNVSIFIHETSDEGVAMRTLAQQFHNDVIYRGKSEEDLVPLLTRHEILKSGDQGIFEGVTVDHGGPG